MEHDINEEKAVEYIGCGQELGLVRCERCGYYFCLKCQEGNMKDCKG